MKKIIVILSFLMLTAGLFASDYGQLTWGDSVSEVKKHFPEMKQGQDKFAYIWLNKEEDTPLIGRIFMFDPEGKLYMVEVMYKYTAIVDSGDEDFFLQEIEKAMGVAFPVEFENDIKTLASNHFKIRRYKDASNGTSFIRYVREVEKKGDNSKLLVSVMYMSTDYLLKKAEEMKAEQEKELKTRRKKLSM